mgnify:FL=1
MIKLFKITALIATMALTCAFFGCSNGNSSDENNSNSSSTTTSSFDDCTTATTEVILANGNWTVKVVMNDERMSGEMNIKAIVSNGSYSFTSGTGTQTIDLATQMSEEELNAFNQLTDEEKKQIIEAMSSSAPEGATVTINGTKVTITAALDAETLAEMQSSMDLSELPSNANLKTNSDNTKYIIYYTEDGMTETIYISKD